MSGDDVLIELTIDVSSPPLWLSLSLNARSSIERTTGSGCHAPP